ncbi:hypothetical protein [Lusitaniella coriacea]|uniref:hypothetical protein n=1 Tax=Lusitaniella coriacea TaxID=1983105 RepID=UPI003CF8BD14
MAIVLSPTIDLFIYDLRNELGQTLEEIRDNKALFLQKLPRSFSGSTLDADNQYDAEFVELLGEKTQVEQLAFTAEDYQGYYYPIRFQDVYGLLVDCQPKNKNTPLSVSCIGRIKKLLEEKLQGQMATVGQTWMVSVQLSQEPFSEENVEALAKECYREIFPLESWEENYKSKNEFLGGILFELWHYDLKISEELDESVVESSVSNKIADCNHAIVAIYPNRETATVASYFMTEWMRLLSHRHKTLWNYGQSRVLKQILETDIVIIQNYIENFKRRNSKRLGLNNLEIRNEQAKELFCDYSLDLHYFKLKLNAIETNLNNYRKQVEIMQDNLASESLSVNLGFLQQFADRGMQQYYERAKQDYTNLVGGLELLEGAIRLLGNEVSVIRAKRDLAFQDTVISVGVGVGCGIAAAVISSSSLSAEKQQTNIALEHPVGNFLSKNLRVPEPWIAPGISVILSLGTALIAGVMTSSILWFKSSES